MDATKSRDRRGRRTVRLGRHETVRTMAVLIQTVTALVLALKGCGLA